MHTLLRCGALAHRLQHLRQKRGVRFKSSYRSSLYLLLFVFLPFFVSLFLFSRSRHLLRSRSWALECATFLAARTVRNVPFHFTIYFWKFPDRAKGVLRPTVRIFWTALRGDAELLEPCVLYMNERQQDREPYGESARRSILVWERKRERERRGGDTRKKVEKEGESEREEKRSEKRSMPRQIEWWQQSRWLLRAILYRNPT